VRDKSNNWENELDKNIPAKTLHHVVLTAPSDKRQVSIYDPWKNIWISAKIKKGLITLPDFKRSLVIRFSNSSPD
jgi:hypothetical protein